MNRNEKFVITINRELGSGGSTVGHKVAERLGVPFYNKIIIETLTDKYNLSKEEIENLKGKGHSWWSDFKFAVGIGAGLSRDLIGDWNESVYNRETTDDMFLTEMKMLRSIAEDESCVIAGRCGFFVLREHPNHLAVLIQASMDYRIERVVRKQGVTAAEALKIIEKVDKMRENYVKKYTGSSRYDARNYDLVLRADGMTEGELADVIMQYVKE